jgi:helicase
MEDEAGLEMVDLRDFQIDERLKKMLEENWGISQLFPPQARALPNSLDGRNLMLAIPTASGKLISLWHIVCLTI